MLTFMKSNLPIFTIFTSLIMSVVTPDAVAECRPFSHYETTAGSRNYFLPAADFQADFECLDAVLRAIPENARIVFSEGTFRTKGTWNIYTGSNTTGFLVKDGWKISGQGIGKTTMTFAYAPPNGINYLFGSARAFATTPQSVYSYQMRAGTPLIEIVKSRLVHNVHITGMTLDCGGAKVPSTVPIESNHSNDLLLGAVSLFGNNNVVENLHVVNAISKLVSNGKPAELFIVSVSGHPDRYPDRHASGYPMDENQLANTTIRNITIDNYQGGYCTSILVTGETRGIVEKCRIILNDGDKKALGNGGEQFGLNCGGRGTYGVVFENNYVENASRGLNNDTGPNGHITIRNNQFINCQAGILLLAMSGGTTFDAIEGPNGVVRSLIEGNTISLSLRDKPASQRVGIAVLPRISYFEEHNHTWNGAYAVTIRNNSIYNGPNTTTYENWGIQLGIFPARENAGEYWSVENVIEGNQLYDNKDGQPLHNVLANAPDFTDRKGSIVKNSLPQSNPNVRMSKKGLVFKSWKKNGTPPGTKEIKTSQIANSAKF